MGLAKVFWENYQKNMLKQAGVRPESAALYGQGGLVASLTTRCNFSCKHCLREPSSDKDLPFEILEKLLRSAAKYNFRRISLTGGEPLLYPFFKEAVELIVSCNYRFNFATNGSLFTKFSDLFSKYRKNLSDVVFSLESVDKAAQDDMRQKGSYDKLLEDFTICRQRKFPFMIQTVISSRNFGELFELALFSKRKGAHALRLATAMPCARTESNNLILDKLKRRELPALINYLSKMLKYPIYFTSTIATCHNIDFCNALGTMELGLNVNGDFVQCCDLADHDLEEVRKRAVITSFKDKSLEEALKIISERHHKVRCKRISDYQKCKDTSDVDFNSCFYCIRGCQ